MTRMHNNALPDNPFWDFSLHFYRQPGAEEALLLCQQQYGFNVNIILYILWFSDIGQGGLSQLKMRKILQLVASWHNKVVLPLRRLRNAIDSEHQAELRRTILEEELNAEHVEQLLLYEDVWFLTKKVKSPQQKMIDVCKSISSYCYLMRVKADDALTETINTLLQLLLPTCSQTEISDITAARLHHHPKMSRVVGTQLWLDL
ncbi:MAG: TIGR02444 family protein [Coxiellaceae bacterium]|nr:TIGR02444 family protein [Coxiellaceae bacterium]